MKRMALLIFGMFFVCIPAAPAFRARADGGRIALQCERGAIFAADSCDTAVLSAVRESEVFYRDIRIGLSGGGARRAQIVPPENGGYNPHIQLVSFDGDTQQIFYGADGGGSGGYGFYYVYRAEGDAITRIFSSETFRVPYEARYADQFKIEVKNTDSGAVSFIDLSARGSEYLSQIYREDGALLRPRGCDIWGVNVAEPFYINAEKRYGLEIYARITGLYGADAVGTVVMRMKYENGGFASFFDMTGVYGAENENYRNMD